MKLWNGYSDIITGGIGLSLGAGIIERLPANAATAGVTKGFSTAGSFFPIMGTLGASSIVINQLKGLKGGF